MSREISSGFRNSLEDPSADDRPVIFCLIDGPMLSAPIRVVNDVVDFVWQGLTWTRLPFELVILSDNDRSPTGKLRVYNPNGTVGQAVQALTSSPRITISILAAGDFGPIATRTRTEQASPVPSVEYECKYLRLRDVTGDIISVEGTLFTWDISQEPWPSIRTTPDILPGIDP